MFWYGYGNHWSYWGLALMGVFMVAFWGAIIWAVYHLATSAVRQGRPVSRGGSAKEALDERLARGEIGVEEYSRLRALIDGPSPVSGPLGSA
jgi:putative membrane protein